MFWANLYTLSPEIEALLDKEDVSLQELIDQEEIVSEFKSHNKKLVDYLTKLEVIEELIMLSTKEPPLDVEETWRYKYASIACEILTCNVQMINEKLAGSESLLAKLYSFIDTDKPLNPLLASFFSKIIGTLLIRKSDQVLEFLKGREKCVDRLLQHLETSAIMDLVLKLVTKVEDTDMRSNILNWLNTQQLIQQLIKLLSPTADPNKHTNAAQLLCDIIKSACEYRITSTERTDPDPILNTLESEESVTLLLDTILCDEQSESSIVGGIQVLLVLLGQESSRGFEIQWSQLETTQKIVQEEDPNYKKIFVSTQREMQANNPGEDTTYNIDRIKIQNATLPYLDKLQKLLLNPPPKPPVKTTVGLLESPLGNTRLHIAKLFTALLSTENIKVFQRMSELETFQTLLDLFFKYSWNNFLHTQVDQCLALVIYGDWQENSNLVYTHIFAQCKLIDRILEAWDKNENKQNKENGIRQGYMGHLINIANTIVKKSEKSEDFDNYLKHNLEEKCLHLWETIVNTQLVDINSTHQLLLGGKTQPYMTSSEDSADDYNPYTQDAYVQQVYTNYQEQQMTSQFIENYGFHDDKFNDGNDALQPSNSVDQITTMPFNITEEDLVKQEEVFNKICEQKQKAGLEDDGIAWVDEGELTFQTVIDKRDWPFKKQHDSISSDEDEDTKEIHMDIDSEDSWDSSEPLPSGTILPEVNPWASSSSTFPTEEPDQWADFNNFDSTFNTNSVQINPEQFAVCEAYKQEVPETTTVTSEKESSEIDRDIVTNNDSHKEEKVDVDQANSESIHVTTPDASAVPIEAVENKIPDTRNNDEPDSK